MLDVPISSKEIALNNSPKPSMVFLQEGCDRLRCAVAACDTGAARGDHHFDFGVADPSENTSADGIEIVAYDRLLVQSVTGIRKPLHQ